MFCDNCGQKIDDESRVCPHCGAILDYMDEQKLKNEESHFDAGQTVPDGHPAGEVNHSSGGKGKSIGIIIAVAAACAAVFLIVKGISGRGNASASYASTSDTGSEYSDYPHAAQENSVPADPSGTQRWGTVTGRLVDAETKEEIPDVKCSLTADDAPTHMVETGKDGSFSFQTEGQYSILFEKERYETFTLAYSVNPGDSLDYGNLEMRKAVDMSGFVMTDGYDHQIGMILDFAFNESQPQYGNPEKYLINKEDVGPETWSLILYVYVGANWVDDPRIEEIEAGTIEEKHRVSLADAKAIAREITGRSEDFIDKIIEQLAADISDDCLEVPLFGLLGGPGNVYLKENTDWTIEDNTLIIRGNFHVSDRNADLPFTASFSVGDPNAPMPWVLSTVDVTPPNSAAGSSAAGSSNW